MAATRTLRLAGLVLLGVVGAGCPASKPQPEERSPTPPASTGKGQDDEPARPNNGRPPGLLDVQALPPQHRQGARAVAAALAAGGEDPQEFSCEAEEENGGRVLVFHLWHASAFLPENRGVLGNPGGKCRDVWYDVRRGRITETLYWQ